ncbi:hypothetical protein Q8F55_007425 [Vanrija albida]|uniref:Uncharacterized protein n=1 Tax=Vanrija albida TaxID=181172 RepID=A0ABR3PTR7_9TREE
MPDDPGPHAPHHPPPHARWADLHRRRMAASLGNQGFARFGGKRGGGRLGRAPSLGLGAASLARSGLGLGVPSSSSLAPNPRLYAFRTPSASSTDLESTAADSDTTLGSALEIEHTLGSDTETERGDSDNDDDDAWVEKSLASLPLLSPKGPKGKGVDAREYGPAAAAAANSKLHVPPHQSIDMMGSRRVRNPKRVLSRSRRREPRNAPDPAKTRPLAHLAKRRRVVSNGSVDRLTRGMVVLSTSEDDDANEVGDYLEQSAASSPPPRAQSAQAGPSRPTTPQRRSSSGSDADEESDGERSPLAHKSRRRRDQAQLPTPPPSSPSERQLAQWAARAGYALVPVTSTPAPRASTGIKRSNSHLTSPDVTPTRPRLQLAEHDDEDEGDNSDAAGTVRIISSDLELDSDVNSDADDDDAVAASSDLELGTAPSTPTPAPGARAARAEDNAAARTLLAIASSPIATTSAIPIATASVRTPVTPKDVRHNAARIRYQNTVPRADHTRQHGDAQIVSVADSRRPAYRAPPARAVAHDTQHLRRSSPTSLLASREKSHRSRSAITRTILAHAQRTARRFVARVKDMDERRGLAPPKRTSLHTWRYVEEVRPALAGQHYVKALKKSKTAQQARSALLRRHRSKNISTTSWRQNDNDFGATKTTIAALEDDDEVETLLASPSDDVEMFDSEQVDAALGLLAFSASALPSSTIGKRQRSSAPAVEAAHRQQRRLDLRLSEVGRFLSLKAPYLASLKAHRLERREAERAAVAEALRRAEEAAAEAEERSRQAERAQVDSERAAAEEASAAAESSRHAELAEAERVAAEFNRTARARDGRQRPRAQPYNVGNEAEFRARIREQRFTNARRRQEAEQARAVSMEQDRRVRAVSLPPPSRDNDEDESAFGSGTFRRQARLGSPLVLEAIADADEAATEAGSEDDEPVAGPSNATGSPHSPVRRSPASPARRVSGPRTLDEAAALVRSPPPRYELPIFPVLRAPVPIRARREAARLRAASDPPGYTPPLYRRHSPPPPPPYNAQVDGGCVMPPVFLPEAAVPHEAAPPRPGPSTAAMAIADRRAVDVEMGEAGPGPSTLAAYPSLPLAVPGRYVVDRPRDDTAIRQTDDLDLDALDDTPQASSAVGFLSRFLPRWW